MNVVRVKPGVEFTVIAPGGFVLLSAIQQAATTCGLDLTITSACDGVHSGLGDPHHRGEAYDVRTKDMTAEQKQSTMEYLRTTLGDKFYVFLESPDSENEHFHGQVRKGTVYP